MLFSHMPVMPEECMAALAVKPDGLYVDCTVGGGGHSFEIARRGGRIIGIDRDEEAIAAAGQRLAEFGDRVRLIHGNFGDIKDILGDIRPDGALIDLGVSSHQLDDPVRGFSYVSDAPLDMRMDRSDALTAFDVINTYPRERLTQIFYDYGEEKFAQRVATAIVEARQLSPINTTLELSSLISKSVPRPRDGGNPAKRVFQAVRIEVNHELDVIEPALRALVEALTPGGRLAVITFHSLEDRIAKQTLADLAKGCVCPPDFPVCVCGRKPQIKLLTRKPLTASPRELSENPRSHSAKLRSAERLGEGYEGTGERWAPPRPASL